MLSELSNHLVIEITTRLKYTIIRDCVSLSIACKRFHKLINVKKIILTLSKKSVYYAAMNNDVPMLNWLESHNISCKIPELTGFVKGGHFMQAEHLIKKYPETVDMSTELMVCMDLQAPDFVIQTLMYKKMNNLTIKRLRAMYPERKEILTPKYGIFPRWYLLKKIESTYPNLAPNDKSAFLKYLLDKFCTDGHHRHLLSIEREAEEFGLNITNG